MFYFVNFIGHAAKKEYRNIYNRKSLNRMLTQDEILQFEKDLLKIAGEDQQYDTSRPFVSVLERNIEEVKKGQILYDLLDAALNPEATQEAKPEKALKQESPEKKAEPIPTAPAAVPADVPEEVIEDDESILTADEDVEETVEDEDFAGFVLPDKYRSIADVEHAVKDTGVEPRVEAPVTSVDVQEPTLGADLSEIQKFNLKDYEEYIESVSSVPGDFQVEDIIEKEVLSTSEKEAEELTTAVYSEEDETLFFENLRTYSIFLQRAVIEICNTGDADEIPAVINAVLEAVPPTNLQRYCEKILGYLVPVFKDSNIYDYEALNEKLGTISASFIKVSKRIFINILPIVAAGILILLGGFTWVVQPLRAWWHYKEGYAYLQQKEHEKSETLFKKASSIHYLESFYFKYAEEYMRQKSYYEAEKKYQQLMFGLNDELRTYLVEQVMKDDYFRKIIIDGKKYVLYEIINFRREGFLNLISFMKETLGDYNAAIALYDLWNFEHKNDLEFQLGKADSYIEMYDLYQDKDYLNLAGETYVKAISNAVNSKKVENGLIQRLRWAFRTEGLEAKKYIYTLVFTSDILFTEDFKPEYFSVYTELVEYLLQSDRREFVPKILAVLFNKYPDHTYVKFLQAKYFYQSGELAGAMQELAEVIAEYGSRQNQKQQEVQIIIEAKILQAELTLKTSENIVYAEKLLNEAQKLYEQKLGTQIDRDLAKLYFLKSKIMLGRTELDLAEHYARKAMDEQYNNTEVKYHSGVIQYLKGNWNEAGRLFLELLPLYSKENEGQQLLLFSLANTLYKKKNYEGALVYYKKALAEQYASIQGDEGTQLSLIAPGLNQFMGEKVDTLAYIKNNMGASFYALYRRFSYDEGYLVKALRELREAHSIFENRNRTDNVRKIYKELPALNLAIALGNAADYKIQIFDLIATELPELAELEEELEKSLGVLAKLN